MSDYQYPSKFYEELYGVDRRTVKRWKDLDRPLDDVDLMGEFLSSRGRKTLEPEAEFVAPSIVTPAVEEEPENQVGLDDSFFRGDGVLGAIDRLKKAEKERAGAFFAAVQGKSHSQVIQNRLKEWQLVIDALRKLEKDAPPIREMNDLTVDVAELTAAAQKVIQAFVSSAENLPSRAAPKCEGLSRDEIAEVLESEIEVVLRGIGELANVLKKGEPSGEDV